MTSPESKPGAQMPGNAVARRQAKILFGFFLCCIAALIIAFPFTANAFKAQPQVEGKAASEVATPQLPLAPVDNRLALPYETQPIMRRQSPTRHGGPDAYGYIYDDETELNGPTFTLHYTNTLNRIADSAWQRGISGTTDPLDDGYTAVNLPFSFNFYGSSYAQMYISTNGNVHFRTPNDWYPETTTACLPNSGDRIPKPMIAPDWFDFKIPIISDASRGGVYTDVLGTAPNRQYSVIWYNVQKFNPTTVRSTFELLLYENGEIRFQYYDLPDADVRGLGGMTGIQNIAANVALQYSCRTEYLAPFRVVRIRFQQAARLTIDSPQRGGAPGATLVFTPTLINLTGQDNLFSIAHAGDVWTTTIQPTRTITITNGSSIPVNVSVRVPLTATIGSRDVTTLTVSSDLPSPGAYTATLVLTSSVSSYGVDFSRPNQVRSGDYGSIVTYTSQLINTSPPATNNFLLSVADADWETTITPSEIDDLPHNGTAPFTVTVRVPQDATLGAFDAISVIAEGELPQPRSYYGVTVFTTTAGLWVSKEPMPIARSRGTAVMLPQNGHVYVIGGESNGGTTNIPIEEYSPSNNRWTPRARLTFPVSNIAGAVMGDAIYIPGGYNAQTGSVTTQLQVYYPLQDRVAVIDTDPLPVPRMGAGVAMSGGKLYVIGGSDDSLVGTNTVYEYDPARPAHSRWQLMLRRMPTPRVYLAAAVLDGFIYAVGGMPGEPTELNTVEAYNPLSDAWSTHSSMSRGRAGLTLIAVDSSVAGCGGYLYALGGGWQNYTATAERYDPHSGFVGAWGPLSSLASPRRSLFGAYSPNTLALMAFGGWSGQYEVTSEAAQCSGVLRPPTPTPTVTPCPMNFSDVQPTDYFYTAVSYLYCAGVISGYQDGTFRPGNNTTRGQLSKIIVLAEGWPINTTGGPHFSDVPADHPFYTFVETAYNHNVISGYSDGTFRWGNNITRAQLCKIVVIAEGWDINTGGGPHFSDVPETDTFYPYVETAFNHNIISGYSDGSFHPGYNATRGQISKIVYQAVTQP